MASNRRARTRSLENSRILFLKCLEGTSLSARDTDEWRVMVEWARQWKADDSEMPLIIIALKQRIVKWFGRTTCIKDLTGSAALVVSWIFRPSLRKLRVRVEREIISGWIDNSTLKAARSRVADAYETIFWHRSRSLSPALFLSFPLSVTDDGDNDGDNDDDRILPRQNSTANKARRADANQDLSKERSVNTAKNNT